MLFRSRLLTLPLLLGLAAPISVSSDQLILNKIGVAAEGYDWLNDVPYIATYCSKCGGDTIQIWDVQSVELRKVDGIDDYQYEVFVTGQLLFQSQYQVGEGEPLQDVTYLEIKDGPIVEESFDFAYLYIPVPGGWRCLGKAMEAPCTVPLEWMTFPQGVMNKLYPLVSREFGDDYDGRSLPNLSYEPSQSDV